MKKYSYVYFNIVTCWIHYEEKIPWVQTFFWSSAIARMEWNGMTDIIQIIPIIDPLSDRTGTATVPECKWVLSEWWIEWLYKWWKSVLYTILSLLNYFNWYKAHNLLISPRPSQCATKYNDLWPQMSRDMWFPTMWHFDKCWLRRACAASLSAYKLQMKFSQ